MREVSVGEAQFQLEKLIDEVRREPVAVTRDGECVGVLVSAKEFADLVDIENMWMRLVAIPRSMQRSEAELMAEIERRLADDESGRVNTTPWEEVKAQLLSRLSSADRSTDNEKATPTGE